MSAARRQLRVLPFAPARMLASLALAALGVVVAPGAVAQSSEAASITDAASTTDTASSTNGEWTGHVTPYLWAFGLDGRATPFAGAPTIDFDFSFGDLAEDADGAFFLWAYARRDRLVLLGDFTESSSSKDGEIQPGVSADGSVRQTSLTLAGGWRVFEDERGAIDVLGGLRQWSLRASVAVPAVGVSRSPSERFIDPIIAVRASTPLSANWSLVGYADVGPFGVGSEHTHQWLLSANYLHGDRWAFSFGLRQLAVDYRDGGTRIDATFSGPLIGASWRF